MHDEALEPRVAPLKAQVGELRNRVRATEHDARAVRVLVGGADRDVGELGDELPDFRRATNAGFTALRQDMVDMHQEMSGGFTEMQAKSDLAAKSQQHMAALILRVIDV